MKLIVFEWKLKLLLLPLLFFLHPMHCNSFNLGKTLGRAPQTCSFLRAKRADLKKKLRMNYRLSNFRIIDLTEIKIDRKNEEEEQK